MKKVLDDIKDRERIYKRGLLACSIFLCGRKSTYGYSITTRYFIIRNIVRCLECLSKLNLRINRMFNLTSTNDALFALKFSVDCRGVVASFNGVEDCKEVPRSEGLLDPISDRRELEKSRAGMKPSGGTMEKKNDNLNSLSSLCYELVLN